MIEFIRSVAKLLNENKVNYLIVGGAAKLLYNQNWRPSDLDVFVFGESGNLKNLNMILKSCEMISEFRNGKIVRIVGKPYNIDIHPKLDGLNLTELETRKTQVMIEDTPVELIGENDLRINLQTVKSIINGVVAV